MRELEIQGFTAKEALHFSCESKKLSDLAVLKQQEVPGPFTSSKEIQTFINSYPDSKEKNKRMYIEVRFAKESSLSLKRTASVFKLKSGCKDLTTEDYAINLCKYFDCSKSHSTLTIRDLNNVLTGLKGELKSTCDFPKHFFIFPLVCIQFE